MATERKKKEKKKEEKKESFQNKLQYSCEPKLQISPLRLLRPGSYLELSAGLHVRGESQAKYKPKKEEEQSLQRTMPKQISHFISNFELSTTSRPHISTRPSVLGDVAERRGKHVCLYIVPHRAWTGAYPLQVERAALLTRAGT